MIEQHYSLTEKFLKKGVWLYLFSFVIAPIGYIIKIIISNELTVSEVGIFYGIISLITILSAYNDLGMTESLKHFIPQFVIKKQYDKVKSILFYALFSQIISSLLIAGFFFFGADYIAENYFKTEAAKDALQIFAFFFIGLNVFQTINNFFMAVQDTFASKITEIIRMGCIMIAVLYIFFGNIGNISNYSYTWVIGLYIGILFTLFLFYKKYYQKYLLHTKIIIEKHFIKTIIQYSFLVFIGTSAGSILSQIDMQMILYLLGTTYAGYYTNYLSIIGIPFLIIGPIFALLFPVFSEMYSKKQFDKIRLVKQIFTKNFLLVGIMFNIFFFVFSEVIAQTLFGAKYLTSGVIVKYSILLLVFNFLLQINFNILAGIAKVKERIKILSFAIFFNIIMNFIFIQYIGVYGAAFATGFGWVVIYILSEKVLGKQYRVGFDWICIMKNVFIMGILGFFMFQFGIPIFEGIGRLTAFGLLGIYFIIWCSIFSIIQWKDLKYFIGEVKKIRKYKDINK